MESLVIEGKKYISSKRAAELMGYTQDYIGQLARSGKISAERISGVWYVSEDEFSGLSNKKGNGIANESNTKKESNKNPSIEKNKNSITLEGVDYISSKRAAQVMGYTQDYIGQLCRGGKIEARQIGRGWYVPKSVVYKSTDKVVEKKQEIPQKEVSKVEALGDVVVFKKDVKDEIPIKSELKLERLNVVEQTENEHTKKESEVQLEAGAESSVGSNEKDYYYPSFLSTSYSIDDTPLVPEPKRSREPVLHQIVSDMEEDDIDNSVAIRRDFAQTTPAIQRRVSMRETNVQNITNDILNPARAGEHKLSLRSPMSLMKIASMGVAVLLFASMVTFVPSISVFSSNTGTLKTVFLLKSPQHDTLKAEAAASVSKTSLLETIFDTVSGLFESKIEYKAK
ncbi:hypothetical protein ACFL6I_15275 [candidate division KSB1 bacterium]